MTSIPLNLLKMLESLPDFRGLPPLFLLLRFLPYWNVPERHTSQATWAGSKGMTGYGILFFPLSLIFGLSIKTKHNVWKVHLNRKEMLNMSLQDFLRGLLTKQLIEDKVRDALRSRLYNVRDFTVISAMTFIGNLFLSPGPPSATIHHQLQWWLCLQDLIICLVKGEGGLHRASKDLLPHKDDEIVS